jgi:NAD(P)-dependent dehydrogenase (short-subunit alcohol dehydrogenase family)/acyl carrier protein
MDSQLAGTPAAAQVVASAPAATAVRSAATHDLHATMLAVVTEKTGYPTEMLEPGMALDTDLGIDSIKRVEILAAVRERVPALPEFDTTVMAGLRTLGEIVAYMDGQLGGATAAVATAAIASAPVHAAGVRDDIHAVMLAVVTEKTGYPTEMLEPGMALDTDLGIDSIKRVEILAAVRERVPALPEFDTTIMAGLRTLGEIVAYMDNQLGGAQAAMAPAPATPAPVAAALAPDATPRADAAIRRYVLQLVPRAMPGLAPPFLVDGTPVYVTDDGDGVAQALAEALSMAGAQAVVCTTVPPDARSVVCLTGLVPMADDDTALAANEAAFAVATTIAAGFEANGGLFVTVQDTGGDFGLTAATGPRAWSGGLAGLAKTAAQEWPKAVVRALDIGRGSQTPEQVAARLAQELLTGAADREIGLTADGRRLAPVSVEGTAAGGTPVVDEASVVVISGGGRGVTAAAAVELARSARPRIALLGRTALEEEPEALRALVDDAGLKQALLARAQAEGVRMTPKQLGAAAARIQAAREIRATLQAIEAAGSAALYIPCDITDAEATAAALQTVRAQWGPITAIVHGAGVLADKRLAEKSADDFRQVFGTKIGGLRSLLAATQQDPLAAVCLFSSVAGRTGNAGQSDYAMANEVLNRVANELARQRPGCVVKSIGWGPWEGGMVTPVLKAKFDELGVPLIPLSAGAQRFVAELQQGSPAEVEVVIGGMPQHAPLVNPAQAQAPGVAAYDILVSEASHPYLCSHQINGAVVLPLVLVQEWFLRAANAGNEGPIYRGLQKLRVMKGIPLPQFEAQRTRLRVQVEAARPDRSVLKATLFDAAGVVRFAAQVVQSPAPQFEPAPAAAWPAVALSGADLYGSKLFHGPQFAALQIVDQLGDTGAQALLLGSQNLGWGSEGWQSDPALLDGGLQLARLWGYERLQKLTLPTAVESLAIYLPGLFNAAQLADRQVRCMVQGQTIGQSGTRSDLWFYDAQTGELLAALRGLEMYVSSEAPLAGGPN